MCLAIDQKSQIPVFYTLTNMRQKNKLLSLSKPVSSPGNHNTHLAGWPKELNGNVYSVCHIADTKQIIIVHCLTPKVEITLFLP